MRKLLTFIFGLLFYFTCFSQAPPRKLPAVRINQIIAIDGDLKDSAWINAPVANDFVEWRPNFGAKEGYANRTEIKLLYDDEAIYVAGYCHEPKDSMTTELVGRDVIGANDFVGILFDTYHDKINGFGYYVTPLGEQYDAKYSSTGEDGSWNSVYTTAAKIVSDGWTFEMKIPYAAIRFSSKGKQDWGFNITRRRKKSGQQFMWNPNDPKLNGLFIQAGEWTGIENIKVPVRLSVSPYFSTYLYHYPYNQPGVKNWSSSVSGGMDVKYGINQSFTLDMTLVPDFGQVQSDNQVLNLTPFEVKYNEYRTFFTEGTDLFSKGNLFYSRRIGGSPINDYGSLLPNERVLKNPSETKLINAIKISGRTSSGFGVGVLNAITAPQYATIEDTTSKAQRKAETNPLTNYNIVVFDQALKHNSSISLINTSVWRSGADYDANVTAGLWDIYDKNVNYNFFGKVGVSQLINYLPDNKNQTGYIHDIYFAKTKGNFTWTINQSLANEKYEQRDMGYFTNNNYLNHYGYLGYKWLQPKSFYKNLYFNLNMGYNQRYVPRAVQNYWMNVNVNGQLKNLWNAGLEFNYNGKENDFYEPRIQGKVFVRPYSINPGFWVSTNYAKKYAVNISSYLNYMPQYNSKSLEGNINQQFRFNNKLTISTSVYVQLGNRTPGFAQRDNGGTGLFGLRERRTLENVLTVKYNFNNKMGLNFRARHYWSKVRYQEFFTLTDKGELSPITFTPANADDDPNNNVNFFNIDMTYTWQFAQGSFINIVWKDASLLYDHDVNQIYFKNFGNTWKSPQANSLSLRVIYYLDYLSVKRKRS
jgi:hypothetical protein